MATRPTNGHGQHRRGSKGGLRQYNLLLVGQSGSGKTALAFRASDGSAPSDTHSVTIGVDYKRAIIDLDGEPVMLQLWDSSGHERFTSIIQPYYKTCNGLVVAYDLSDRESFEHVLSRDFQARMKEQVPAHAAVMLVGTKSDKADDHRAVPIAEARKLALSLGWSYMETSALQNINVVTAFTQLTREIIKKEAEERAKDGGHTSPTTHKDGGVRSPTGASKRRAANGSSHSATTTTGGGWVWGGGLSYVCGRVKTCCCVCAEKDKDDAAASATGGA